MTLAHVAGSAAFYWAIGAELLLVVWTGLLFLAPRWSGPGHDRWRFRLWALGAALLAALVTLAGKTLEVWPGHPLFPSGHTAYAVTAAVFLVSRDRRWLGAVVPLVGLQAVALVLGDYHVPVDIVGGAAVGIAVGVGLCAWLQRAGARRIATS
ncbi:MAG TPA: phosphatase PAP2 family protein [Solirubrobacteraceae bacterium]|nr:phosphatase PAP2 family protein [Solirubrobacteraceae bacterium]